MLVILNRIEAVDRTISAVGANAQDSLAIRAALFLFGFLLNVNFHLPDIFHIRYITDLIVFMLAIFSIVFCTQKFKTITVVSFYGGVAIILVSALFFQHDRQYNENYNKLVVVSYIISSMMILFLFIKYRSFHAFCIGMLCGYVLSVAILFGDAVLHFPLSNYGLAPIFDPDLERQALMRGEVGAYTLRLDKAGGIWAHGNEAGPALALTAGAAAWLSRRYRAPLVFQLFLALYIASFTLTLNRSGLIAVGVVCVLVLSAAELDKRVILRVGATVLLTACAVLIAYWYGALDNLVDAITKRLVEDQNSATNSEDRFATTIAGLEMIIRYPFGIGTEARFAAMYDLSGFRTPHNGFIAVGFDLGLIGAALLSASVIYVLVKEKKNIFMFYNAVVFTICLFFEELLSNPIYMLMAGLIIARAIWLWCDEDDAQPLRRP